MAEFLHKKKKNCQPGYHDNSYSYYNDPNIINHRVLHSPPIDLKELGLAGDFQNYMCLYACLYMPFFGIRQLSHRRKQLSMCSFAGVKLTRVDKFAADLTWSKHIQTVCYKAQRLLGYMFRTFSPHCSPDSIIRLYKAQVLPILEYGSVVWDPHFIKDQILLENVQLFALRIATKSWSEQYSTLTSWFQLPTLSSR